MLSALDLAAVTSCSRTCPARRRRSSRARSRRRSTAPRSRASSARPTCSRPTSRASRSSTRRRASSSSAPGPVFANIVLVDEINRAMPRTQSALLEAMAERQVTVDGVTRPLPEPFLVIATENPIEQEGTFPLPEAQLDRFALRAALGYPAQDEEVSIVVAQRHGHPIDDARSRVSTPTSVAAAPRSRRGRLRRRADAALDRRPRARDARGRGRRDRRLRPRQPHARADGARLGAAARSRPRRARRTSSGSSCPVLGHRLLPDGVVSSPRRARSGATRRSSTIRERCLELAPPPRPTGSGAAERVRPRAAARSRSFRAAGSTGLPFGDLRAAAAATAAT